MRNISRKYLIIGLPLGKSHFSILQSHVAFANSTRLRLESQRASSLSKTRERETSPGCSTARIDHIDHIVPWVLSPVLRKSE